jgi:urease accessory protein
MIKKVVEIRKDSSSSDSVELGWFDMKKPNLTATTDKGVDFIVKAKFSHLHEGDILVCEDGYTIGVNKGEDEIYHLSFSNHIDFAKISYEIGNRHQPIAIEDYRITVLDDISLNDIIKLCENSENIEVEKRKGHFKPNGNAHHSH